MLPKVLFIRSVVLLLLAAAAACTPLQGSGPITFEIAIQGEVFSPDAVLDIAVWNEAQWKAAENNANCSVSMDSQTGQQTVSCPPGVVYRELEARPERFQIPAARIDAQITVTSQYLRLGERYRLQISGLSADNCNQAAAGAEGVARSRQIKIEGLNWATTMMACP